MKFDYEVELRKKKINGRKFQKVLPVHGSWSYHIKCGLDSNDAVITLP